VGSRPVARSTGANTTLLLQVDDGVAVLAFLSHWFFTGWESAGERSTKERVDTQFLQGALLQYVARLPTATAGATLEVQNLTDARAFDFVGLPKPSRAVYFKMTIEH
jgi:vitamin B12 transporter